MKDLFINLLLTALGIALLWIYLKFGVFIIESSFFSSLKRLELNCLTFAFLLSYVLIVPIVLIILKKVKEIILS